MKIDFWLTRWEKNETGFHQTQISSYLQYFYGEKGVAKAQREKLCVFVPLCGKSRDMLWLAHNGYRVFGLECSEIAIKDFFAENALPFRTANKGEQTLYLSQPEDNLKPNKILSAIEILHSDFFSLTKSDMLNISDVYDRASLIALPEQMRVKYANKMAEILASGVRTLLVTLSYPQEQMPGPPFSVAEDNVQQLYGKNFTIEKLCSKDILKDEKRMQQRGLTSLVETVYKLTRR